MKLDMSETIKTMRDAISVFEKESGFVVTSCEIKMDYNKIVSVTILWLENTNQIVSFSFIDCKGERMTITPEERSHIGKRNKLNGASRERRVMRFLEWKGYVCVKSSASQGMADIWAIPVVDPVVPFETMGLAIDQISLKKTRLVQVKSSKPYGDKLRSYQEFADRLPHYVTFEIWVLPFGRDIDKAEIIILKP